MEEAERPGPRRVVLLGAGHAHLYTLKRTATFVRRGHEVVLVAPGPFWYSGLATGVLGGLYPPALDQVDAGALVERGGGRFIAGRAAGIEPKQRVVRLSSGPPLRYDVLSLNLGSEVPLEGIPGARARGYAVKPIQNLWDLRRDLEARLETAPRPLRVVIAGGGATGCEIAANVERLCRGRGPGAEVTVLAAGERALLELAPRAARRAVRSLEERGIRIALRSRLTEVGDGLAATAGGESLPFDVLVYAVGLTPPPLLRASGLPTDGEGALVVDEHLRSIGDPKVHGAGDCISFRGSSLPRVGVHAVRQAPVLFHNLLAALEGRPPRPFRPQKRYLLILNLGDGTALAVRGRLYWCGRFSFWLKDRIDRSFLRKYR